MNAGLESVIKTEIKKGSKMTIEVKVPFSIEKIKKAFEAGEEVNALLMISNCMNYLRAICALSATLRKDKRLDPYLGFELIEIENQAANCKRELESLIKKKRIKN